MNVDEVNPFPVLSCEERIRYIEKQRIAIQSLIEEFGLEREVHYTTFNPPLDSFMKAHSRTYWCWISLFLRSYTNARGGSSISSTPGTDLEEP
jgi:hypothetical protein